MIKRWLTFVGVLILAGCSAFPVSKVTGNNNQPTTTINVAYDVALQAPYANQTEVCINPQDKIGISYNAWLSQTGDTQSLELNINNRVSNWYTLTLEAFNQDSASANVLIGDVATNYDVMFHKGTAYVAHNVLELKGDKQSTASLRVNTPLIYYTGAQNNKGCFSIKAPLN